MARTKSGNPKRRKVLRSIVAVLAGMFTIVALSVGTDFILERYGIFPPPDRGLYTTWMLVLALAYRCFYAVAGGFVTAQLAPGRRVWHAVILGMIGTVASIFGAMAAWDLSEHWYPVALVISAAPCTWLGSQVKKL